MKPITITLVVVVTGFSLSGCFTPSGQPDHTATGALAGGVGSVIPAHVVGRIKATHVPDHLTPQPLPSTPGAIQ